jgi:hypothetical protein
MAQWPKEKIEINQIPCNRLHNTNLTAIIIIAHYKGRLFPSHPVSTNQTSVKKKAAALPTTSVFTRQKENFCAVTQSSVGKRDSASCKEYCRPPYWKDGVT